MSLSEVANHFSVPAWKLRRLFTSGLIPNPPRVGHYRAFVFEQLPIVRAALESAGYLKSSADSSSP
jgi:DNA-binding transcriptional MerR regulator